MVQGLTLSRMAITPVRSQSSLLTTMCVFWAMFIPHTESAMFLLFARISKPMRTGRLIPPTPTLRFAESSSMKPLSNTILKPWSICKGWQTLSRTLVLINLWVLQFFRDVFLLYSLSTAHTIHPLSRIILDLYFCFFILFYPVWPCLFPRLLFPCHFQSYTMALLTFIPTPHILLRTPACITMVSPSGIHRRSPLS